MALVERVDPGLERLRVEVDRVIGQSAEAGIQHPHDVGKFVVDSC